ncbi:MAG: ATP-binding protein [Clostridia bacterium]|nr:ATP-binding protein [Clostridia bacterium]
MIGRQEEVKELKNRFAGSNAEFIAVYGRRRVGKTYLVDETFKGMITFRHAGLSPAEWHGKNLMEAQLDHFYQSLKLHGAKPEHRPKDWLEAFFMLEMWLQSREDEGRQLIFLDELPWMDTPKSGFLTGLEAFWNTWACHRHQVMLIVCGSASSWIQDRLINNHGGLYGRLTYQIKLEPFTLRECEDFLLSRNVHYSRYDIVQSYMLLGGIPYYLGYLKKNLSLAQSIDELFFSRHAVLRDEYDRLFSSVFRNASAMKAIVELLYTRNAGFTRKEICEKLEVSSGGILTNELNALIASDFIIRYVPFGISKREEHYKLTDPFCLFYLHYVRGSSSLDEHFWMNSQNTQPVISWRGFAFENVCFNHIPQIKQALGISGVRSTQSAWSKREDDPEGAQIDLLIDRDDHVINACEIKFYSEEFTVDKSYYMKLMHRQNLLRTFIPRKSSVYQTLITTYGLVHNEYWSIFTHVVTLDDLFT